MSQQNIMIKNQNPNIPITDKTTIKLEQPICYQHSQYYSHLCNHQSCSNITRLCKTCISKHDVHSKSVRSQEGASKDIKKNLTICLQKIVEMDNRYLDVTNLMKGTKESLKDKEEKTIKELMKELEKDKQILADKFKKIKQLNVYLDQLNRLGKYFKQLNKKNLLNLRIQLSSDIGLNNFKQKNELFAQFIKKDVFQSFKQYQSQYDELIEDFLKLYQNNFTFKLNQIVKMKTSKKQMMRRTREREAKTKKKRIPEIKMLKKNKQNIRNIQSRPVIQVKAFLIQSQTFSGQKNEEIGKLLQHLQTSNQLTFIQNCQFFITQINTE